MRSVWTRDRRALHLLGVAFALVLVCSPVAIAAGRTEHKVAGQAFLKKHTVFGIHGLRQASSRLAGPRRRSAATAAERRAAAAYARLPTSFVPNVGQIDRRVRFSAFSGNAGFYFTKREAVFSFAEGSKGHVLRLGS